MPVAGIRTLIASTALAVALLVAGCGGASPLEPSPASPAPPAPGLSAPTAKSPTANQTTTDRRPVMTVVNAVATGNVGSVTYEFEVSEVDTFPANSRTSSSSNIAQTVDTTSWQPPSDLIPMTRYYWHARANHGFIMTDWSKTETFTTP